MAQGSNRHDGEPNTIGRRRANPGDADSRSVWTLRQTSILPMTDHFYALCNQRPHVRIYWFSVRPLIDAIFIVEDLFRNKALAGHVFFTIYLDGRYYAVPYYLILGPCTQRMQVLGGSVGILRDAVHIDTSAKSAVLP